MEDKLVPRWQKLLAAAVVIALVVIVVVFHDRLGADFWPLDSSRIGPNLLASLIQAAVLLLVAALLWPPTRRWLHRFIDHKLSPLRWHHRRQEEHNEWMARHLAETYRHSTGKEPEAHPHFDVSKTNKPL